MKLLSKEKLVAYHGFANIRKGSRAKKVSLTHSFAEHPDSCLSSALKTMDK